MKCAKPNRMSTSALQQQRARKMRRGMTDPERKLWRALRARLPLTGTHFRRQVPLGPYIADFCSFGANLVTEVDGDQHGCDRDRAYDARRTAYLESLGYRVLRFSNRDVMVGTNVVLDTIFAALEATPTPHPSPQGRGERQASPQS